MKTIRFILMFATVFLYAFSNHLSGQTSGTVTAGNWYRIAENTGGGKRANARFILTDQISGGGHSTLEFIAGISYNDQTHMGFTLLNHNIYSTPTFTKIRILENSTYDAQYLEVYVERTGSVAFSILDNLQNSGWDAVAWQTGSVPAGYAVHEYDVNNSFVVGDSDARFIVKRGGKVGIGTTSPATILDVLGQNVNFYSGSGINTLNIGRNSNEKFKIYVTDSHGYLDYIQDSDNNTSHVFYIRNLASGSSGSNDIRLQTSSVDRLTIKSNGKVGIGKTNPIAQLDINGSVAITGSSHLTFAHPEGNGVINFGNNGEGNLYFRSLNTLGDMGTYNQLMILTFDGKLGIGTWEPGDYMLAVNGKIRAKEVNVDTDWSDFVFDPDYNLCSLNKIEKYISVHGHLPGIPSSEEVKENGVNIGDMQSKLLQKVEELTLYLIEIQKENRQLKERIDSLENKIQKR
ncbi:MAG: hypothetical protein GXO83_10800 [Chlorobi bacterium]|nr:hypothetical protein [Chlorobiota bacterium]